MATDALLDLDELLRPIDGDKSTGEDLRLDASPTSVYYQIKDARTRARELERHAQMNGDEDTDPPDWSPILMLAPTVLAERSKDLEITAYLLEALVRMQGIGGLKEGFGLVRSLAETFGEDLYPEPDEDGIETLVAPLTGLNGEDGDGTLILPIKQAPFTGDTSVGAISTADYLEALELDRASSEQKERRIEQGATTMEDVRIAVAETPAETFRDRMTDLESCIETFKETTTVLDGKFGQHSPPSTNILRTLEECRDALRNLAGDKLATLGEPDDAAAEPEEGAVAEGGATAAAPPPKPAGLIETREDAFKLILKAADYFRKAEPHSPLSYALERIVRWGRLPLPELMKELIADDSSVLQMFNLVGIDTPTEE